MESAPRTRIGGFSFFCYAEFCLERAGAQVVGKRERRTNRQIFLDVLTAQSAGKQVFIGNISLRDSLGWDQNKYERIKWQLNGEGAILLGKGQGGSVALARAPGAAALKMFVSYSHCDEDLKVLLLKHLEPLRRAKLIDPWHDGKLMPGEEWDKSILHNLEGADIILLLISVDFINSPYCYDRELERALERHEKGEARVIPVILRSCLWSHTPFSKLQALPKNGKAVTAWPDRDEALVDVAEGLRRVAEELGETK